LRSGHGYDCHGRRPDQICSASHERPLSLGGLIAMIFRPRLIESNGCGKSRLASEGRTSGCGKPITV
jgi:hypothetical protein